MRMGAILAAEEVQTERSDDGQELLPMRGDLVRLGSPLVDLPEVGLQSPGGEGLVFQWETTSAMEREKLEVPKRQPGWRQLNRGFFRWNRTAWFCMFVCATSFPHFPHAYLGIC